jgi:hypothetical protein
MEITIIVPVLQVNGHSGVEIQKEKKLGQLGKGRPRS